METLTDADRWVVAHPCDRWIYDKLLLSAKLGYKCGPAGVPVPTPGMYVVRPITNLLGMGIGATEVYIDDDTDFISPGHFWCEKFTGRHLSIDFVDREPVLCVEGLRTPGAPLWKWNKWRRVNSAIPFPRVLKCLQDTTKINCEFIDGKLIEVHQRLNTDMGEYEEVIPVWKMDEPRDLEHQGFMFYNDPDYNRIGF